MAGVNTFQNSVVAHNIAKYGDKLTLLSVDTYRSISLLKKGGKEGLAFSDPILLLHLSASYPSTPVAQTGPFLSVIQFLIQV